MEKQKQKKEKTEEIHKLLADYAKTKDKKVRDKLVNINFILVKKIAHGLARRSTDPVDDLIQIGSIGLIKAIDYFNPDAGARFTTYATHLITGEIRHYLRDKTSMIRAPRELQELSFRINKVVQKLRAEFGRDPTDLEIASVLTDVKETKIKEAYEVDRRKTLVSLDQTISPNPSENDTSLVDTLADMREYRRNDVREDFMTVKEMITKLKEPLAEIIDLIYFQDTPQSDVANILGISQMQVSRRLKKATAALQELFNGSMNPERLADTTIIPEERKAAAQVVTTANSPLNTNITGNRGSAGRKVSRSSLGAKLRAKSQPSQE
jgi:RNA polymerase sigma-B factor